MGQNNISILVTAINGATQTYNVTVVRAASANAKLARLVLSKGTLTPAFATNTTSYAANETNDIASITVTPTSSDPKATLTVNGTSVTSGIASGPVNLMVGTTGINITVVAQDGITQQVYTVTVTRAAGGVISSYISLNVEAQLNQPIVAIDGVLVHQGISPNGDGIGDFLQIDGILNYPDNKLMIVNKRGQLVYETKGYNNNNKVFNGHSNKTGAMQLPGTYFYSLDYAVNGVIKHKTGYIVLKY